MGNEKPNILLPYIIFDMLTDAEAKELGLLNFGVSTMPKVSRLKF